MLCFVLTENPKSGVFSRKYTDIPYLQIVLSNHRGRTGTPEGMEIRLEQYQLIYVSYCLPLVRFCDVYTNRFPLLCILLFSFYLRRVRFASEIIERAHKFSTLNQKSILKNMSRVVYPLKNRQLLPDHKYMKSL